MLGLDRDSSIWLSIYFPVSWLTQFGHGLVTTVVGPTQPYLARNTGVAIDTVNLVWTFGFAGVVVGSLVTGAVFNKRIHSARGKLIYLFLAISLTGVFMLVLPFTSSFPVLVTCRLIQNLCLGAFMTADASLVVYLLGPEKSRPFTMMFHAVIGAGFLATTFMVRPFLPSAEELDKDSLCSRITAVDDPNVDMSNCTTMTIILDPETDQAIPTIAWPFLISGVWCIVFSLGFFVLAFLPYTMPRFYEKEKEDNPKKERKDKPIRYLPLFFFLVFLYYFISCGVERIIQSMVSTFGLCGPLDLSPTEAVASDSFYNGGFMCGRLISAVVAGFLRPRNMIILSLCACVLASVLLSVLGGTSMYALYAGAAILGFFVSWQFGSCFSWVAMKINITGRLSSVFFVGCGFGSLSTPPLTGFIFTSSFGPMSIFYATLGFCILHCIIFLLMWLMARSTNPELNLPSSSRPKSSELKKKNLETIQETQESSCSVLDYRSLNYSVHNLPSSSEVSSTCDYSESDYPSYDYRPPILALEEIKPPPHIHN